MQITTNRAIAVAVLAVAVGLSTGSVGRAQQGPVDVLIRGGMVLDGSGAAAVRADVAIRGGRIVAVGDLSGQQATRTIEAAGRYVTPGFIDIHSHADGLAEAHLASAINNITQGITTVVVGQDGRHAWPAGGTLTEQIRVWKSLGIGNNVIPLVGQGSARLEVMGWTNQPATPAQAEAVGARVKELLRQGAWGISTGLEYYPGRHSSTEELIAATRPVKEIDGFHISHVRNQDDRLLDSVDEVIRIARETGVRMVHTHIKAKYRRTWGRAPEVVARIAEARKAGLPVYADVYPYTTDSDGINIALLPLEGLFDPAEIRSLVFPGKIDTPDLLNWAYRTNPSLASQYTLDFLRKQPESVILDTVVGGLGRRLRSEPIFRTRVREVMADPGKSKAFLERVAKGIAIAGGDAIVIEHHPDNGIMGLTLAEVARARGVSEPQAVVDLTLEGASFTQFNMHDPDVILFHQQPYMAVDTDGSIVEFGIGITHPRSYGTFTRRLRRYVFDLGAVPLPLAIRAATGLAAEIIGLEDRGLLKAGQAADVLVFDPRRIRDVATYRDPHQYSEGIDWVLVNGEVVLESGKPNARRAGQVLLKSRAPVTNSGLDR